MGKVIAEHDRLSAAKNEYVLALQSGGSAVQEIIDKTNRIEAMKNDVEKQLRDTEARIKGEEDQKAAIGSQAAKVTADANKLRDDIKVLEETMVILARRLRRTFKQWRIRAIILTRLRQSLNNLWMNAKTLLNVKRRQNLTLKRSSAKSKETLN